MGFTTTTDSAINSLHETLKLLRGTIRVQTKAIVKQSKIMIRLTCAILVFTFVLVVVAIIQIIFIQDRTTQPHNVQTTTNHQQIPTDGKLNPGRKTLPPTVK